MLSTTPAPPLLGHQIRDGFHPGQRVAHRDGTSAAAQEDKIFFF
jgi:hypothetical protein